MKTNYTYLNSLMILALIFILGANSIKTDMNQKRLNVHSEISEILSERITMSNDHQISVNVLNLEILAKIVDVDISEELANLKKIQNNSKDSNETN